jgi:uncharacterized protein (TIGR02266 family)
MSTWRILVADDEPPVRRMILDTLGELPASIITAQDGEEALRLARAERPDLILLDVEMRKLDGFGVAEALKRDAATASIPLIFIGVREASRDKVSGLDLGAEDYLAQPIDAQHLRTRVLAILSWVRPLNQVKRAPQDIVQFPGQAHPQALAPSPPPVPPELPIEAPVIPHATALPQRNVQTQAEEPSQGPTRPTTLATGQLQAMNLESLVQLLENERRTVRLVLMRGIERGEIIFVDGAITQAVQRARWGDAAVYQLLTWREGTFRMEALETPGQTGGPVTKPNQALLFEGMRRLDELPVLREGLPDPRAAMVVAEELRDALQKQAQPDAAALLGLLDGTRSLDEVLAQSPFDDWTTLKDISYLVSARALVKADISPERRVQPRVGLVVPVEYQRQQAFQMATASNMSVGGVFIQTPVPLEAGEQVVLRFRLPGREAPIKVLGKVVWRNADPNTRGGRGMGIQFLDLTPADRELIERNLAEAIATELSRAQERRERA